MYGDYRAEEDEGYWKGKHILSVHVPVLQVYEPTGELECLLFNDNYICQVSEKHGGMGNIYGIQAFQGYWCYRHDREGWVDGGVALNIKEGITDPHRFPTPKQIFLATNTFSA